jgi:Arc/MetJ-type ribon-helix-helix transcriptional regulator
MWIRTKKEADINMTDEDMAKIRIYATIREDLVRWIDKEVDKLRFANRSHALEYAIQQLIEKEKKKE